MRKGLAAPGSVAVHMDGGRFDVLVTESWEVTLRGPVREVGTGELAPGFCVALRGIQPPD
ncbi:MAG: hypothetical protein GWO24_34485 [Akkermansiaceae bacterium]|nr:hypothetical protein [Akkermansiaceae bacterium]